MQLQVIDDIPLNCVAACWDETYRFLGFVVCLVFFTLSATLSGLHLASVWVFLDTIGSDVVDGGSGLVIICQQPVDQHTGMHQLTQHLCSLVPRPCVFVACSTKFVLQATNAQGPGTWLYFNSEA